MHEYQLEHRGDHTQGEQDPPAVSDVLDASADCAGYDLSKGDEEGTAYSAPLPTTSAMRNPMTYFVPMHRPLTAVGASSAMLFVSE